MRTLLIIDRLERTCLLQPHIETETEGMKTLLFINIRSYNERSDGSYIYRKIKQISSPFFRSCCLVTFKKSRGHLPLVTSGYYQDGRSLIFSFSRSSNMAAMARPCQIPDLGQRLNVKIPTQEKARSVNFPWVARHPGA